MPQPNKIPRPFADSGDKNSIPDSSGSIGFASWQEGFPAITSEPFAQGGVAPKRADFNGIFNALSAGLLWLQQGGVYAYDATTDYEVGNIVLYSGTLYKCLAANGPSSAVKAPTDTTVWDAIATASGFLPLSGGTLTGPININQNTVFAHHSVAKGTTPGTTDGLSHWFGGSASSTGYAANCTGLVANEISTSNDVVTYIRALRHEAGSSTAGTIGVHVDNNGNIYSEAPTPSTTDNSTKIATTAFVNNLQKYETTGTLTKTLDPTDQNYSRVYAQNGVGYFFLSGFFPSVTSGAATYDIYTSSIKPQNDAYGYCICQGATTNNMHLIINTSGKISLRTFGTTVPSNKYFWGAIVFPLA